MSVFAGIVTFDGTPGDNQTEDRIGRALTALRNGRVYSRRSDGALFVQRAAAAAGVGQGEQQPVTGRNDRTLSVAHARLDNRSELGAALGILLPELARTPDGVLILRMFEHWGEAGVARCLGAFAFALWDPDARRLILGRDCIGGRALFFHHGRGFVAFATTIGALLALPGVPREIDEVTLANFMVVNLTETRRTLYRRIERVPSRTLVTIDRTGVRHRHYWSPDLDAPPPYRSDEDYVERARELLDQAVAAAIVDTSHVAITTSGGLDSSAVAATVARLSRAERITCYSLVLPPGTQMDVGSHRYLDERDKVEALARMHPALDVRFFAPEKLHPFEEDDVRYFARASLPALGPANLGTHSYLNDAVAADGHRALLTGNYGNYGLTWGGRFSLLALLRSGEWGTFTHELYALARQSGRGLARTFAGEVLMPAVPVGLRRLIYRLRGRDPDSAAYLSALNPAFIAELDLTRQWQAQGFDPWFGARGWNAARYRTNVLFDNNQFARDLKGMAEELRGYEIRDPLADRRLLEFLLAVPEPMYRRNGIPRSFARTVLADRLPHEILDERRRGAQGVTWFRRLDARRQDIAMEIVCLDASPLARRLIDLPRLKRLMDEWPADEHAAEKRMPEYRYTLARGVHIGRFIRWVEGGNA
jgi:asparagine synthase (glutamine-hydrolysing)